MHTCTLINTPCYNLRSYPLHSPPTHTHTHTHTHLPQITHPAGCFTQFLQFFGPNIFILWKLALLKKKLILFSPPPIGVVCYRGNQQHCLHRPHVVVLTSTLSDACLYIILFEAFLHLDNFFLSLLLTVYCACLLASHVLPIDLDTDNNPQFYVNVADIEQLRTMGNYIACESLPASVYDSFEKPANH